MFRFLNDCDTKRTRNLPLLWGCLASLGVLFGHWLIHADEPAAAKPLPAEFRFRKIVEKHQREMFDDVARYVAQNPEADDADEAQQWLLETAQANGLEAQAVPVAERFLKREGLDSAAANLGREVLCLGLVQSRRTSEALAQFEARMKGVRFQGASQAFEFAQALATRARMSGEFAAAKEVYDRVSSAFPLNPQIGDIALAKLAKFDLLDQPVPRIGADDLQGKGIEWSDYQGKVVLVDFWATNCPPCLAEFPNLKQLYKEYHAQGFEIVGVSLDEKPETVTEFCERTKLPWRMAMNDSPQGAVGKRFKVQTIPALYLADRTGKIRQWDVRGKDLRIAVERLLEGKGFSGAQQ